MPPPFSSRQPNIRPSGGNVSIRNPTAKMLPTISKAAVFSIISFISATRLQRHRLPKAMVVFFVKAISTDPSRMITARNAWGSRTIRRFCRKEKPRERAASA